MRLPAARSKSASNVTGPTALQNIPAFAQSLQEQMPVADQFARIETYAAIIPTDRLQLAGANIEHVFEVGLHLPLVGDAADVR